TNLELHHIALEAVEEVAKFACLWDDRNIEAGIGKLSFDEVRGSLDRSIGIGEKVDVFGGARDDAVRYQCMAASKGESMFAGRVKSKPGHWSETGRLPASGGGPSTQRRMALLPRQAYAARHEQVVPKPDQCRSVQPRAQFFDRGCFAEHCLVHPRQECRTVEVDMAVRLPEQTVW